ncbi:ras-related protein Rab-9B-like [Centruroides vittatus]|uniref:ras-related protein Rab-9B-like n=1 Tax=Centruroides vittatus TaxID=120091 RepID=UPI00350EFE5B
MKVSNERNSKMISNKNKYDKHLGKKCPLLKVVLLGDSNVGKTCLMSRFVKDQFNFDTYCTIGVEFLEKDVYIKDNVYKLQIWDTAGNERFHSLRIPFYRGTDICILTYSVDNMQSFENLSIWKKEFLYYADIRNPGNFPFMVIGNKIDLGSENKVVTTELLTSWITNNGCPPFVETSAKDATNVPLAFRLAVEHWLKMENKNEKQFEGETVILTDHSQNSNCCN